ncbi:tyrosine decarboxylase MfnA [Methanolapillus ohkumae]|uniref:Probable L-tyrosine/L-aspartate decarboxylase n=1 Tax=Methanolapillus ohkumae TaxID=3028298 RepID=A0AA96V761_9EURY|nr:Tryptophan decarboxylase [Methanosarcinaceae archaeon Am2]
MHEQGISEEEIFEELERFSSLDTNFKKVMSSMCTLPHPIAIRAHQRFIHTNIGDPGLFIGTCEMEKQVIEMAAVLLKHDNPKEAAGHLTSGGTESNIEAVYHMKNRFMHAKDTNENDAGARSENAKDVKLNLIVPATAHFSFEKIANMFNLQLRKAELDSTYRVVPRSVESKIDENTIGIIGIAGNTEFGEMDPIGKLSEIAIKNNLPLHIDAAFGGFVYPFLKDQNELNQFGFDLPGVTSVSLDPHKMGFSVIPAGIIVFKNASVLDTSLDRIKVKTPYLTSNYQSTLTGTRPGSAVAATYAVMKYLGREGYQKNVAYCLDLTEYLFQKLIGIKLKPKFPAINIMVVEVGGVQQTTHIRRCLREQFGWYISETKTKVALRLVLMPHVTKEDIDQFVLDLKYILDNEDLECTCC